MSMAMPMVVRKAREQLGAVTGLPVSSTVSARKEDGGWRVEVEVVEKKSLPDSQDILARYELTLDEAGDLLNFSRVGMRRRADAAPAGAESGA